MRAEFLQQKIRKRVLEHKFKSASTSPERGRAERSPVVGRGDTEPRSGVAAGRGQSDPGSPEEGQQDGQGGRNDWESDQQEVERSDFASPRDAPSFPRSVDDEQLSGEFDSLRAELVQKGSSGPGSRDPHERYDLSFAVSRGYGAFQSWSGATESLVTATRRISGFLHFTTSQMVAPGERA